MKKTLFIPFSSIKQNIFSGDEKTMIYEIKEIISYCKINVSEIIKIFNNKKQESSVIEIKKSIMDSIYLIYYCHKCLSLVEITSNIDIKSCRALLDDFMDEFYLNNKIKEIIIFLHKKVAKTDAYDEIYYYENLLDKFDIKKDNSVIKQIDDLKNQIYDIIEKDTNISVDKIECSSELMNAIKSNNVLFLNNITYNVLIKKISNKKIRSELEVLFFGKINNCLDKFKKIIMLRHMLAKNNKKKSFTDHANRFQLENGEISALINELLEKIGDKTSYELSEIKKNIGRNLEKNDILYYVMNNAKSNYRFDETKVITNLLKIIKKIFGITINQSNNVLKCYIKDKFIGNINLDLKFDEKKKIVGYQCVHLSHNYTDINNNSLDTELYLVGNNNFLTLDTALTLYKEVGMAIQLMICETNVGYLYFRDNYNRLLSKIMEHIFWDTENLMLIFNDFETVKQIKNGKNMDYGIQMSNKLVDMSFDKMIYKPEIINTIKQPSDIAVLYKHVYMNIFKRHEDNMNFDTIYLDYFLIIKELAGSEGTLYNNIAIDMFGYKLFSIIKDGKKNSKKVLEVLSHLLTTKFKTKLGKLLEKTQSTDFDINEFIMDTSNSSEKSHSEDKSKLIIDRDLEL